MGLAEGIKILTANNACLKKVESREAVEVKEMRGVGWHEQMSSGR